MEKLTNQQLFSSKRSYYNIKISLKRNSQIKLNFNIKNFQIYKIVLIIAQKKKNKNKNKPRGFPGGAVVENLPADAGDTGSSPGLGGSHMPRSD